MAEPVKRGTSRRGFVKYLAGIAAAVVVAVSGYGLFVRSREESHGTMPPSQTTRSTVPQGSADLILINGKILTVDSDDRIVEAVAVKDGKIQEAGSYNDLKKLVGSSTKQVDLLGKTVTPGFVDSHLHMNYYGKQFDPRLIDIRFPSVKTKDELIEKIRKKLETAKKGEWIACNQGFIMSNPPNRKELDQIAPDNPVYLLNYSGQYAIVNSQALQLAGISKDTANPYGGVIAKDPSTGEPTGFLYHYPAIDMVRALIPGIGIVSSEEEKGFVLMGAKKCFEAGYTSIQDVIVNSPRDVKLYIDMANEGRLPLNVYMLLYVPSLPTAQSWLSQAQHLKGNRYNFAGWKIAVDGGVPAGTALMYTRDVPASKNSYIYHTQENLNEMVAMFHNEGYQVGFHVIGDKAIDMALDAIEYALQKNPRTNHRHRLEHAVIPSIEALDRMKRLGVVISTQPQVISVFGAAYERAVNQEQLKRFMPLKTILNKGIPLAFGCDVPASPVIDPKWMLIGATTRMTLEGEAIGPEESISMKEALRALTMGSAYAAFEENIRGSIEPGKIADLVVWSEDLYSATLEKIVNMKVEATIVEGVVVYKAGDTNIKF